MSTGSISPVVITEKYEKRPVAFKGLWEEDDWKFKVYTITHKSNSPADEKTLNIAKNFAKECISKFNDLAPVYGLGYIILHKGMDSNFIVVNFWAGENMLRTHTMISQLSTPYDYEDSTHTGMNVCVWDALVHNFERNLWVKFVLGYPEQPQTDKYMTGTYSE